MTTPVKKLHEVGAGVAALIGRDGEHHRELLLIQRGPACSHGAGTWSLPGGWIDYGETMSEAVAREVDEETGLVVLVDLKPVAITNYVFPDNGVHSVCVYHLADIVGTPDLTLEEGKVSAYEWVPIHQVEDRELFAHLGVMLRDNPHVLDLI